MPRPNLFRTSQFAYHVTCRSNNKEWFYIPLKEAWNILSAALGKAGVRYGADFHAFVLLSNHFHLLVSTPYRNLDLVMQYALSAATRAIQTRASRINHVFGIRYRWSVLQDARAMGYVFKYIYRNPVRAGICDLVEKYPFSTLNNFSGPPIVEGYSGYWRAVPRDRNARLAWLNKPVEKSAEQLIGRALRRYKFQFSSSSGLQRELRQLTADYCVE